jgi:hypothetical protein
MMGDQCTAALRLPSDFWGWMLTRLHLLQHAAPIRPHGAFADLPVAAEEDRIEAAGAAQKSVLMNRSVRLNCPKLLS